MARSRRASTLWTFDDTFESYRQGWGIFIEDDGKYAIHALDDPHEVSLDVNHEEFNG